MRYAMILYRMTCMRNPTLLRPANTLTQCWFNAGPSSETRPSITKTPDKRPVFAGMLAKRVVVSVDGSADGGRHPPLRSDVT